MKKDFLKSNIYILLIMLLSSTAFSQMPNPAIVGYWENWGDVDKGFVKLQDIDSRYNVVHVSFSTAKTGTAYDMQFVLTHLYPEADFKADIVALQSEGKKVFISIGGQNGKVLLTSESEKDIFVTSVSAIIDEWGFDGVDIDLEGESLNFTDINVANPGDVRQNLLITGIREILANHQTNHSKKLLLTMAPETIYVQGALSQWAGDYRGAYLPIVEALKDDIDMLNVQLYNSGSMYGLDGQSGGAFSQGNADFVVAMTEAVIMGFIATGDIGTYSGMPASKVGVGLPGCHSYDAVESTELEAAIKYLTGKGPQPGNYTLKTEGGYPDLLGMMTWSINSDRQCDPSYGYVDTWSKLFTETPYIEISNLDDLNIRQGAEDGGTIKVELIKDYFVSDLNYSNWEVQNLPSGVSVSSVERINDSIAYLTLQGNSNEERFIRGIVNVTVIVQGEEILSSSDSVVRTRGVLIKNTPLQVPGILEAESYNLQWGTRLQGTNVGWMNSKDWMEYEIDVAVAGEYSLDCGVATDKSTGRFKLYIDDVSLVSVTVPNTGSWSTFEEVSKVVSLEEGIHTLKFLVKGDGFSIDYFDFQEYVDPATGLAASSKTERQIFYPNPSTDIIRFTDVTAGAVTIYNMNGKLVKSKTPISEGAQLNLSDLSSGFYMIEYIDAQGETSHHKLIKN